MEQALAASPQCPRCRSQLLQEGRGGSTEPDPEQALLPAPFCFERTPPHSSHGQEAVLEPGTWRQEWGWGQSLGGTAQHTDMDTAGERPLEMASREENGRRRKGAQEIILKLETCNSGSGFVLMPLLLAWAGNQLPTQKLGMMRNRR